jgi:hypothetical protein
MTQPTPLNICIYCGRTKVELTDEHIIPKGFGNIHGDILHKASCKDCAVITSAFELTMLRENLQPIRTVLQLAARSGKKMTIRQKVRYYDGHESIIDVPYDKYVGIVGLPVFESPHALRRVFDAGLLTVTELQTFNIGRAQNKDWYELHGIEECHSFVFKSNKDQAFARFILKMSYCAAVKYYGYDRVEDSPVRHIILGNNPNYASWLGNLAIDTFSSPTAKNSLIRYTAEEREGRVLVSLQFFPVFPQSPIYHTLI